MQSLQRTLLTIAAQLKGLGGTARLFIASLMVIVGMSLFLVWLYAAQPTMAPLGLKTTLTPEAKARAISFLETRNISYDDRGGDIRVPVDQKYTVLAALTEGQFIDAEQISFESLIRDASPFLTRDQNRQRYLVAKMNELAKMISQMSGIHRASVVLDQPEGAPGLGRANVQATASVTVTTRSGELSQTQVDAITQLVARSHAGLRPQNVAVIDARTSRHMQARGEDDVAMGKYLEAKLAAEQHAKAALQNALLYIPGVSITVNAQVETKQSTQSRSEYGEPKIGVVQDNTRSITSSTAGAGAEPGVRSNTGATIASSGRATSQMTDERSETATVPKFDKTDSQIRNRTGYALQINATIGVPKSYFLRLWQDRQPAPGGGSAAATPDAAALDALVQEESQKIKGFVTPLIDTGPLEGAVAGIVAVSMIPDFGMAISSPAATPVSTGTMIAGAPGDSLLKYAGLGGLALVSLLMMALMVRKASARESMPSASELVGIPPALAAAESDLVGEADEATPALEGLELNDEAVRRTQMLDQISEMINNTPDDAANLLRRWIKSEA